MRHSQDHILHRLDKSPINNFVFELEGEVMAVIYSQRINSIQPLINNEVTWATEDLLHDPLGSVLQLLRINTFKRMWKSPMKSPKGSKSIPAKSISAGQVLRQFCLKLAERMALSSVCTVTRTQSFEPDRSTYEDHVNQEFSKEHPDPGLNFHTLAGASIMKTMPGWRPEDTGNEGHGVLIKYAVKPRPVDPTAVVYKFLIDNIMELIKHGSPDYDIDVPIMDTGLDSLGTVRLINMVNNHFGISLSEATIDDFTTTEQLAEHAIGMLTQLEYWAERLAFAPLQINKKIAKTKFLNANAENLAFLNKLPF